MNIVYRRELKNSKKEKKTYYHQLDICVERRPIKYKKSEGSRWLVAKDRVLRT